VVAPLTSDEPRTIGPYALLGLLRSDGLGQVFLARSANGDTVEVRIILAELASDPGFRNQFRSEVTAARKVSGPFVVPVVDADLDGDVPWLATAHAAGPSLAEWVGEHGPVPASNMPTLAAGLAVGLRAIHAAGVVHRNLNPSNVLLAEHRPRLTDFGIWKAAAASGLALSDFGSPEFSSPEQAQGYDLGPPSDIFSLGAVLVFACSGHGPFGAGTSAALMYRLVNSPANLGDVPEDLRWLVEGCLAKQPGKRPSPGRLVAELGVIQSRAAALAGRVARPAGPVAAIPASQVARVTTTEPPLARQSVAGLPPWNGRDGGWRSRRGWSRPPAPAWIVSGLLAASAAALVFILTGAHPSSDTGQAQVHAGAAVQPAATSSAPITSNSAPSASSPARHPSSSPAGQSNSVPPAVLQAPSPSAFVTPSVPPASPTASASPSPSSSGSASASASPSSSASASASPSSSPTPTPSPTPSSSPTPTPSPTPSPSPSSPSPSPSSSSPSPSPSQTTSSTSSPPASSPPPALPSALAS
jgi:eukaryotic-like serine/threonine-protein kinase